MSKQLKLIVAGITTVILASGLIFVISQGNEVQENQIKTIPARTESVDNTQEQKPAEVKKQDINVAQSEATTKENNLKEETVLEEQPAQTWTGEIALIPQNVEEFDKFELPESDIYSDKCVAGSVRYVSTKNELEGTITITNTNLDLPEEVATAMNKYEAYFNNTGQLDSILGKDDHNLLSVMCTVIGPYRGEEPVTNLISVEKINFLERYDGSILRTSEDGSKATLIAKKNNYWVMIENRIDDEQDLETTVETARSII